MKYCVYITTNVKNNIKYVGSSTTDKVLNGYIGSGTLLGRAISNYGKEMFEAEVISKHGTRLSAFRAELALIRKMQSKMCVLYNVQSNSYQELSPEAQRWTPTREPKKRSFNFRMDSELVEIIDDIALERGHTRTRVILDYIQLGLNSYKEDLTERVKVAPAESDIAKSEVEKNRLSNQRQYDEMIQEERRDQTDSFRLAQGLTTFNAIIEKHKVELEKKYK